MDNACFLPTSEASGGLLSKDEVQGILDRLMEEKRHFNQLDSIEAQMMKRGAVILEDIALAAAQEKRAALKSIISENRIMAMTDAADKMTGNPVLGLHAAMVGVNAPFEGAQLSADALAKGIYGANLGGLLADLKKANLTEPYNGMRGEFEIEVAEGIADLNRKVKQNPKISADAKALAAVMWKYQNAAMERENRAGAFIRSRDGFVTRQSHNPSKMRKLGREKWKAEVRERADFQYMGVKDVEKFLDDQYAALESGVRLVDDAPPLDVAFKGANLAKKESAHRIIEFKTPRDAVEYARMFGSGSLKETYIHGLERAGQATALMEVFGTNPEAMVKKIEDRLAKKHRGDKAKRNKIFGLIESTKAMYAEISGDVNIVNPGARQTVADVGKFVRSWQTMAKLGGTVISAVTDIAYSATNRAYHGRNMLDAWGDAFSAPFKSFGGDHRLLADSMGVGFENMLGAYTSRFNASDTLNGKMAKMMQFYFKMNLLSPWTDAHKRGTALIISHDLARESGKAFRDVPEDLRRILTLYGFNSEKWDVARQAVETAADGRSYLMPGAVDKVKVDGGPRGQRLTDETRESLFALIVNETDTSIPTPGARERAILRRGYRPGTAAGEAARFLGQFKSFGVTGLTKVLGRQVYGKGAKTLGDAFLRGQGNTLGLVNAIAGVTVLGYFAMQAKEIRDGKNPRPSSVQTFLAAFLQGGGAGIYGDFLFGEATRYGNSPVVTMLGPLAGTIEDIFKIKGQLQSGDMDVRADALRLAKSNIPFANLFYTKAALDYLIFYHLQESLNPGYLKRVERRVKKENNQTYWLQPSSIVKTGGGFR